LDAITIVYSHGCGPGDRIRDSSEELGLLTTIEWRLAMSRIELGGATTDGSESTMKLPSAEDTKAWQTAFAEAAKGRGPLTPAIFDGEDGSGHETQIPDLVIAYGRDDNSGASNPNPGATALAVYGNEKEQPLGAVFVDRATNTATVMQFNPQTGSLVSSYTFHDVAGNVPPPPGSNAFNENAAWHDLVSFPTTNVPGTVNYPQDAGIDVGHCTSSSAATALNGICSNVDIADSVGDPTHINSTSLYFSNLLGWVHPTLTFGAPSAGIGASIYTPSGAELLINSSTGINPDPSDTSRMFVQYADPSTTTDNIIANGYSPDFNDSSESPALSQKPFVTYTGGVLSRYDPGRYEP
jgi:hypothetical protein